MAYRKLNAAPMSSVPEERRGKPAGRFCLACHEVYALHAARHQGKPLFGRDHVASPCAHEGELFSPGAAFWEEAVEVLPPTQVAAAASA